MAYTHYDRLTALDTTFLDLESPDVHMHVGSVGIFDPDPLADDGGIDFEQVLEVAESGLARAPRFRQKLARMPVTNHPVWVDDEHFNLLYHVRHTALPVPGDERRLKRLVGRIMSQKLDRSKPMWELWFIEGLEGGQLAVVSKVHHCLIDGISGVDLLSAFMGPDEDYRPEPVDHRWMPRPAPSGLQLLSDEMRRRASLPLRTLSGMARVMRRPESALEDTRHAAAGFLEGVAKSMSPASETSINVPIGPHRRFDWTRFDLSAVKEVAKKIGGTVNDVVLVCVAGAVRKYLAGRGDEVKDIDFRAFVPVSTRNDSQRGKLGNRVSMLVAPLPVDEPRRRGRVTRVVEETGKLKGSGQSRGAEILEEISDWTTTGLLTGFSRLAASRRSYNLVVTNVPGPQIPVYLSGARMLESYPLVPLFENQALGVALFSYDGGLYWGFNSDWDVVHDLHDFVLAIDREFEGLRRLSRQNGDAMAAPHYDRLSQLDNSFLVYEDAQPSGAMHVASTSIHEAAPLRREDGSLDIERIEEYVLSRLDRIPRYRQRLAHTPMEGHPVWVDDDTFNIRYHVRHSRLPHPGSEQQLKRMVGRIFSQRLDRDKPLWELWVIEGLEGDRIAVVSKVHHCMVDGVSGSELISALLTKEPMEKPEPPARWSPRPAPSRVALGAGEAGRALRAPLEVGSSLLRLARDEDDARHHLAERLRAIGRLAGDVGGTTPVPFNRPVGPHRRIDWMPMSLASIKAARRATGGTLNDVVLATAAGAMGRFLSRSRGLDLAGVRFRVMAPVSVRTREEHGTLGNRVSAWTVDLPLAEPDPLARVEAVRKQTERLKQEKHALGAETLTRVTEWTGSALLSLGARLVALGTPFNTVITNVPGPRTPLYMLESKLLEIHPHVPLMGTLGLGIALFSYDTTLSWGFSADWDLVPDLHDLVLATAHSFEQLRTAAGVD